MLGYEDQNIKSEPLSDEEDSLSRHSYRPISYDQIPMEEKNVVKKESRKDNSSILLRDIQDSDGLEELAPLAPAGPAATPVSVKQEPSEVQPTLTLETLESAPASFVSTTLLSRHMLPVHSGETADSTDFVPQLLTVGSELLSDNDNLQLSGDDTSDSSSAHNDQAKGGLKSWTQHDMENALEALKKHNMSLTKASAKFGIPSTTLWQRAHRLGIDTPKKEGVNKSWSQEDLDGALHALRAGTISANKASKAYGIPSSTLYKIARREGIRLAAPFNAAPTSWRRADLERALASIRCGVNSVQKAATQFGIPTGTLYGRCKREGIELSRSNPAPWSEDAMGEALEAVRVGQMSINQAAIHYNLPYSSLYGRFKRCKSQSQEPYFMQQISHQENADNCQTNSQEFTYYHQNSGIHAIPDAIDQSNNIRIPYIHYASEIQDAICSVTPELHEEQLGYLPYQGCCSTVATS